MVSKTCFSVLTSVIKLWNTAGHLLLIFDTTIWGTSKRIFIATSEFFSTISGTLSVKTSVIGSTASSNATCSFNICVRIIPGQIIAEAWISAPSSPAHILAKFCKFGQLKAICGCSTETYTWCCCAIKCHIRRNRCDKCDQKSDQSPNGQSCYRKHASISRYCLYDCSDFSMLVSWTIRAITSHMNGDEPGYIPINSTQCDRERGHPLSGTAIIIRAYESSVGYWHHGGALLALHRTRGQKGNNAC